MLITHQLRPVSPSHGARLFCFFALVAALGLGADWFHAHLPADPKEDAPGYAWVAPNGGSVGLLEQQSTAADLVFLQMIQYLGTPSARKERYPNLSLLAGVVTDVDPLYGYAYEVAGVMLGLELGRYSESNLLLAKGMSAVPERWQLPFFAAFNRWYGEGDYAAAGPLLLEAAQLPGAPRFLSELAARLFREAGEIDAGLELIDAALGQDLPPQVREDLENRRRDLLVERELRKIDDAAARFAARTGALPNNLEELLAVEQVSLLPFPMAYDRVRGEATSPLLAKRLRLSDRVSGPSKRTMETLAP